MINVPIDVLQLALLAVLGLALFAHERRWKKSMLAHVVRMETTARLMETTAGRMDTTARWMDEAAHRLPSPRDPEVYHGLYFCRSCTHVFCGRHAFKGRHDPRADEHCGGTPSRQAYDRDRPNIDACQACGSKG